MLAVLGSGSAAAADVSSRHRATRYLQLLSVRVTAWLPSSAHLPLPSAAKSTVNNREAATSTVVCCRACFSRVCTRSRRAMPRGCDRQLQTD